MNIDKKSSDTDSLFDLIQSLTKQEKRYFILFAQKNTLKGKNNCLELFKVIEKQKKINERAIHKKFKNEKFLKHFNVTKYQLILLILKSMRAYHAQSSVEARINQILHSVEFLISKKFRDQGLKQLATAKKLAKENEKFSHWLEIIRQEQWFMRDNPDERTHEAIEAEAYNVLELQRNLFFYTSLFNKITRLSKRLGALRNEQDKQKFEKLITHPFLTDERNAKSISALQLLYACYTSYYFSTTEYHKGYQYTTKMVSLFDKYQTIFLSDIRFYILSLNMHTFFCTMNGLFDEGLECIKKIRSLKTKNMADQVTVFESSYRSEFNIYLSTRNYTDAIKSADSFEPEFEKLKTKINPISVFLLSGLLTYIHFGVGNYKRALKWSNDTLNSTQAHLNHELELKMKILNLMIHYDLSNYDLLDYKVKSLYRYLFRRNRLYQTESVILQSLKKMLQISSASQIMEQFKLLKSELELLIDSPLEKQFITQLDIIPWLQSKLENKRFLDIIKQQSA